MKRGGTHLRYEAEHAVNLESGAIVHTHLAHADRGDTRTAGETLVLAHAALVQATSPTRARAEEEAKGPGSEGWRMSGGSMC